MLSLGLLGHSVRCLLTKTEKQDASAKIEIQDVSENVQGSSTRTNDDFKVETTDQVADVAGVAAEATRDTTTTTAVTDISEPKSVEDDEDEDDASFFRMDKAIPLLKKIFEEESSITQELFDARPSLSSDDDGDDEGKGGAVVPPKTRFLQLHRELNMSSEALMTNVWR